MAKSREDFSDQELRSLHTALEKAGSREEREALIKSAGVSLAAVSQWFRRAGMEKLSAVKSEGTAAPAPKGKRGRPKGSVKKAAPAAKRGRPPKASPVKAKAKATATATAKVKGKPGRPKKEPVSKASSAGKKTPAVTRKLGTGLSRQARETAIRLLEILLED
jgi:hypothetical protein